MALIIGITILVIIVLLVVLTKILVVFHDDLNSYKSELVLSCYQIREAVLSETFT